jgi:phage tail protein X
MINRHSFSKIKKDDNGRNYLEDILMPLLRPNENDIYIYSVEGDSLDLLAEKYYGNGHYWFILADVNNFDFMNIGGGIQVRIPDITSYIEKLEELNI